MNHFNHHFNDHSAHPEKAWPAEGRGRLPFELDPQIIHHIIYSQAGSIGKAVIELLMNSVDADAKAVRLSMTKDGFHCADDGKGFASRDDVIRYFGRFGTPHAEGDATYGRFRLGRGQIMAHASTVWRSNGWEMTVDTRAMGYHYLLEGLAALVAGCSIAGRWYEPLSDSELMSAVQEVRDLVRYTPISIELNDRLITRDPRTEKWDAQDEFAYYRVKEEGAVSIYNQGVLVRHDASHLWGAGGLIVSKQAIGLNVSRTEILRKTCPVWKAIAKQFGTMAEEITSRLGDHRKTEARREKSARALLSGDPKITGIYDNEEVITLLPGKRHVTMHDFLRKCRYSHNKWQAGKFTVVENDFDVPKGEAIASEGLAVIVHPKTLERFGCYNAHDLCDCMDRINANLRDDVMKNGTTYWGLDGLYVPELIDFTTLRDAFLDRTLIVTEKKALDKETRRAWTALRGCLQHYARLCTGGQRRFNSRTPAGKQFQILLGESNTAEAWTDGDSYIAVDVKIVKRLKSHPLKTTAAIFSLIEHEIAHEGDSLDCGHDEAFYQRFHDIVLRYSEERQRHMHLWLMRYTASMEGEGKRARGEAWRERYLVDRAGSGRAKKGLTPAIEDVSNDPVVVQPVPVENRAFIDHLNIKLIQAGLCPTPPDWSEIFDQARNAQTGIEAELRREAQRLAEARAQRDDEERALWAEIEDYEIALGEEEDAARRRFAALLNVTPDEINQEALGCLMYETSSDEAARNLWVAKPWERACDESLHDAPDHEQEGEDESTVDAKDHFPADVRALVQRGETVWALERNAAAAGFFRVEDYLKWRAEG